LEIRIYIINLYKIQRNMYNMFSPKQVKPTEQFKDYIKQL